MTTIGSRPRAALLALHILAIGALIAPVPALAMQILDAADHAELAAEISATGVNRIALAGDRIAKVVRSPDGFAVEHDAVSGDLYLRPAGAQAATPGAEADGIDPVTLFIGTERGFTYRLTLLPAARDSGADIDPQRGCGPVVGGIRRVPARGRAPCRGAGAAGARRRRARSASGHRDPCRRGFPRSRHPAHRDLAGPALRGARVRGRASGIAGCGWDLARAWIRARGPRRDHRQPAGSRPCCRALAGAAGHRPLGRAARRGGGRNRRRGRSAMSARADRRPAGDANDADAVRRRQLLLFSVIAAVVLVAVAAWLGMGGGKTDAPQGGIDAGIVDPDAAEIVWTRRSEARLNKVEDALKRMEQEAGRLRTENEGLRTRLEADTADALRTIDAHKAMIDELERRLQPAQPGAAQGNAPADDPWFRGQAATPAGGSPQQPVAPVRTRMIETFELEGAPQSSAADPRSGPGAGGRCRGQAGLGVAAGGRPCRGGGAGRRRRLGRGLVAGRSPPGPDAHYRPRLDRGGRRNRPAGRRRRLHRDRRGPRRPLLREGLCPLPHHDLRRAGARHRGRDRRRRLRRRLRQDRRARPGGEPRGRAGREGVPRRRGLRPRPGRVAGVPAPGGGDGHRRRGRQYRASAISAGPASAPVRRAPARRSPTT